MPYSKLSDVPPSLAKHKGVPLTVAQANQVAEWADAIKAAGSADEPYAVAWAQFERIYRIQGDRWVRRKTQEAVTMAVTKTEDGVQFSASAYAYVPDPDSPSTWKIRLEETPGKVTRAQLGRAAAAVSPAGFRGQKPDIPAADLSKVKAKIRAAYKKLGVDPDDMPKAVREALAPDFLATGRVQELLAIGEVKALDDGDFGIEILAHGLTVGGERYYTEKAVETAVRESIYDGVKMYINHSDPNDEARRGHRDLGEWAGTVKPGSPRYDQGRVRAVCHAHSPQALSFLADPIAKRAVGLSQDADITYYTGKINGKPTQVVQHIDRCHSVDFVPAGNAFGRVLEAASKERMTEMADLEGLTTDVLQEARPDLVDEIEARLRESAKQAAAKDLEAQLKAAGTEAVEEYKRTQETQKSDPKPDPKSDGKVAPDDVDARIKEAVAAATAAQDAKINELEEDRQRRDVAEIVKGLVEDEQGLTAASKGRILETFADQIIPAAEIGKRVHEAAERERRHELDLLKQLGVKSQVKGLGASASTQTKEVREAYQRDLEERLRESGLTEEQIKAYMDARA